MWFRPLLCAAVAIVASYCCPVLASADGPEIYLGSLKPEFFVVSDGDKNTVVTLGVAQELQRQSTASLGAGAPWIVPEPSWGADDITARCAHDPNALGGVVVTYYHGFATHFFLLWQSETTTLDISANIIACNRAPSKAAAPTLVGVIGPLPGAGNTPWVVRRSEISIPLVTFSGYLALVANRKSNNATLSSAAVLGALFGGAADRDIPGYSDPVRLRAAAQHVGDDLAGALGTLCTTTNDVPNVQPRSVLCTSLGYRIAPVPRP